MLPTDGAKAPTVSRAISLAGWLENVFLMRLSLPRFLLGIDLLVRALIGARAISNYLTKALHRLSRTYCFFFLACSQSSLVYSAPADWPAD